VLLSLANHRERELKAVALRHEQEAREQRDRALQNFRLARDAVDEYCTKVGQDVRLKEHDLTGLQEQLLATAVSFYQKFIDEHGDDPELRAELGRAYIRLALVNQDLSENDKAVALARKAIGIFEGLVQADPKNAEYRYEFAKSHADLGHCSEDLEAAVEAYRQALALWGQLVKDYPVEPKYALGLARAGGGLGEKVRRQRNLAEAERLIQDSTDTLESLRKQAPKDEEVSKMLARNYRNLANTYRMDHKTKLGIAAAQTAEKLWVGLAESNPKDPYYHMHQAITVDILALLYEDFRELDQAGEAFARAVAIHKDLADNYPSLASYQDSLGRIYINLGLYQQRVGKPAEAIETFQLAVAVWEKLAARYPRDPDYPESIAHALANLAGPYSKAGKADDMDAALRQAVTWLGKCECKSPEAVEVHTRVAANLGGLAQFRARKGALEQAVELCRLEVGLREKVAARPKATAADAYALGVAYGNLAFHLGRLRKHEEALTWAEKSVRALEGVPPDEKLNPAVSQALLGALQAQAQALGQLKRHAEAVALWDRALERSSERGRAYLRLQRALAVAHTGDHKRAATELEELAGQPALAGAVLYDLACGFSLCAAAAREDARLPEPERNKAGEAYAVRAVAVLKRAQAVGFFKDPAQVAHAQEDSDLDALRRREDFKKLMMEVGAKGKPGEK
jgi:tetratricopeptide (TPR) repeat protein